jgi:chromosome partitioning protein
MDTALLRDCQPFSCEKGAMHVGMTGRVIAIANQKGGVGKTTLTREIGIYLASLMKKALVIDLDP